MMKCIYFLECFFLLLIILNGYVNGIGFVDGFFYIFNCSFGYFFVGEDILYCILEGRWNVSILVCFKGV